MGLVWTLAFAAAAVGDLNLISVAFAAMFIGIAVDFGIQVCVRYRDERYRHDDLVLALRRTGRGIGGPLFLAAITTSVGFLAFVPTAYRGVSELGIIAGAGMLIAFLLNVTLLPAMLMILKPGGERTAIGYAWAAVDAAAQAAIVHGPGELDYLRGAGGKAPASRTEATAQA